ncbi:MAG: circularly permuted type 2 ATP-grasp protein [Pseudomonadota bacterium]|nr:circularly permuted type 2 ATP-grasp protein [Pseudomonadota bacterium]
MVKETASPPTTSTVDRKSPPTREIDWFKYPVDQLHDELIGPKGPRPAARGLTGYIQTLGLEELRARQAAAALEIKAMGITFTVYSEGQNIDRVWPMDMIPRVIAADEWRRTEAGLKQRVAALNHFLADVYGKQKILKDKVFPEELIRSSRNFRPQCRHIRPAFDVWAHICGSDLVRDKDGTLYVLEDNLRVPSGVSYMMMNRLVMKFVFPELFQDQSILPVDDYPAQLFDTLASLSPRPADFPCIVVLTPGIYNSAYFEHSYLAQQMGVELVTGSDLLVDDDDCVYMQTIAGPERVDVIYRRIDDDFLDPECFRTDTTLGVPGLMRAWRKGTVALANAPGAGVADDKVVYSFVPDFIRYYLDEEPLIPNVPTYRCMEDKDREYVLANLESLVVKPANESGGYGMLVGRNSTKKEREQFATLIQENPRNYIAQPTLSLSTVPTLCDEGIEPRHVDLRPFILSGSEIFVTMGGLTRVALRKGSLVVNSSQGGGSKDTWVVEPQQETI